MGPNAYVINLSYDYGIRSSFNIEDLVAYKSPTAILDTPFDEPLFDPIDVPIPTLLPLNLPFAHKESIDAILDKKNCFYQGWRSSPFPSSVARVTRS